MSVERAVAARSLRSTVVGASTLAAATAFTTAVTAITYVTTFPDAASRRAIESLTSGSVGLAVLFGPAEGIGTVGGYTFYKGFVFLTAIAAVWSVLATTRVLRGEEDAGRWQLVVAGATRPARATAAAIAGVAASIAIVAAGTAVGTGVGVADRRVGFGVADLAVHTLAMTTVPLVFAATAALTSQLCATRRAASGAALGVVGAAFVVRMIGDAGPSTRWVRWLSPFGWVEMSAPLTADRVAPLLPALGTVLVLGGAAIAASARRDAGDALVARRSRRSARSSGPVTGFGLLLRQERGTLAGWAVGAAGLGASFGVVAHLTRSSLPPSAADLMERFGLQGSFGDQYLGVVMLVVAAVLALLPANQIAAAASEELEGRLSLMVATGVRRSTWLWQRLAVAALAVAVGATITALSMWTTAAVQGTDLGLGAVLGASLNIVPICSIALGLGAVALAVAPRVAATAVHAVVGWSLVADVVASIGDGVRWVGRLGLFHYVALVPAAPFDPRTTAWTMALAAGLCWGAVAISSRRDLLGA